MKNNYFIAERNRIVEEHLPSIDRVLRRNRALIQAAHLEDEDVYQDLAIRLILSVERYDPGEGSLGHYLYTQLLDEMQNRQEIRKLLDTRKAAGGLQRGYRWEWALE